MEKLRWLCATVLVAIFFAGCSSEKSDLDEARYLLGKADADNGQEAYDLVAPLITSLSGDDQMEAYRLYTGAQIRRSGVDAVRILSRLVYKEDNDTVKRLKSAITVNANTNAYLRDAKDKLGTFIASSAFTNSTNNRAKLGLYFQLGMVEFFLAIETSIRITNLSTFDLTTCKTDFVKDENYASESGLANVKPNLTSADSHMDSSGLNSGNDLRELVQTMNSAISLPTTLSSSDDSTTRDANATIICTYLQGQL